MVYKLNLLGFLLIVVAFFLGIKLPDWDFKLKFTRNFIIKILHLKLIGVNIYLIMMRDKI